MDFFNFTYKKLSKYLSWMTFLFDTLVSGDRQTDSQTHTHSHTIVYTQVYLGLAPSLERNFTKIGGGGALLGVLRHDMTFSAQHTFFHLFLATVLRGRGDKVSSQQSLSFPCSRREHSISFHSEDMFLFLGSFVPSGST